MIEWIQTGTIVLIVASNWYQQKNFQLMEGRLRELELKHLEYLNGHVEPTTEV